MPDPVLFLIFCAVFDLFSRFLVCLVFAFWLVFACFCLFVCLFAQVSSCIWRADTSTNIGTGRKAKLMCYPDSGFGLDYQRKLRGFVIFEMVCARRIFGFGAAA